MFVVGAVLALYLTGIITPSTVSAEELSRVLVIAASPDENGDIVGQIIVDAEVTADGVGVVPVSPALKVAIPGTSYSSLGDAYPFGGGAGTAEAYARATDGTPLPFVAITAQQLAEAVQAAGGVTVDLPAQMNVFDGEQLYSLKEGRQTLSAAELRAVLKGAPYLTTGQRTELDEALASALVEALQSSPDTLADAETNLAPEAVARLRTALER